MLNITIKRWIINNGPVDTHIVQAFRFLMHKEQSGMNLTGICMS